MSWQEKGIRYLVEQTGQSEISLFAGEQSTAIANSRFRFHGDPRHFTALRLFLGDPGPMGMDDTDAVGSAIDAGALMLLDHPDRDWQCLQHEVYYLQLASLVLNRALQSPSSPADVRWNEHLTRLLNDLKLEPERGQLLFRDISETVTAPHPEHPSGYLTDARRFQLRQQRLLARLKLLVVFRSEARTRFFYDEIQRELASGRGFVTRPGRRYGPAIVAQARSLEWPFRTGEDSA